DSNYEIDKSEVDIDALSDIDYGRISKEVAKSVIKETNNEDAGKEILSLFSSTNEEEQALLAKAIQDRLSELQVSEDKDKKDNELDEEELSMFDENNGIDDYGNEEFSVDKKSDVDKDIDEKINSSNLM